MRPVKVRLLTQRIDVTWVEGLHHVPLEMESDGLGQRAMGIYDMVEQTITMDVNLGWERERQTFLHENLHAMVAISGLEAAFREDAEEHIVGVLAPVLLSWLRDNPEAVAFLMETRP